MATYIDNIVKFHSFSKSPVSGNTTLGGAVNPSGHTITTSQVRAQDIPAFLNSFQGTKEQALTWIEANYATPAHNDIVYYGGEFKAGFSTPKCLKYVSKTVDENGKLVDLAAQECQWQDFDITSAATLKNADEKDVIAVHQNCQTVFVDGTNNASTNSNRWSLFVKKSDGTILDHFVASTDKIVAGQPSLGYNALVLYNNAAIDEGELDANYIGNTFAGIVHLNKQYNEGDDAKFKVTCFEYIGEKLDSEVARISAAVFGAGGEGDEDVSLTQKVAANTAAISVLNGDAQTTGSVAKAVADAEGRVTVTTNALADRIAQLEGIQHFSVVVVPEGDTLPATPVENTIYLVKEEGVAEGTYIEYIAYKSGETIVTEKIGSTAIDLSGYTTDEEFAALASTEEGKEGRVTVLEGQVATLTGTAETEGSVAKALADAKDYTDTAIATELAEGGSIAQAIAEAKEQAIANAKVTLTAGNGITIPNSGTQDTAFTISVDTEVIATKASVEEVSAAVTGVSETVASLQTELSTGSIATGISEAKAAAQAAQTTADEAKATADTAVQSVTRAADSSDLITVTDGTDVTISLSTEVATKTYVGEQAAAAQAAAEQTAAGELSAAVEQIGKDIDSAIDAAKSEIKGTTDALDTRLTTAEGKVTTLEGQVAALLDGEDSVDSKIKSAVDAITETTDAISEAVEGVKATADTAVQSASGDIYVSAAKETDSTNIKVTTNIDAIASAVDTALVAEGTAVATAIADAAAAGTGAADAVKTAIEAKSLDSESTGSDLVKVTTAGTVGTGMTTTVDTTALSKAITDTTNSLSTTAITEQSVSGAGISVTLGGEVGAPTLTGSVTTASYTDGAWTDGDKVATGTTVAAAIKDVDDKINTLHSTAVTYKVFETKPEASEELKGIIALVPAGEGDSAVAGSYIEWLCVESVAEDGSKSYSWERIGTTAADFSQYAKTADLKVDETTVNGLTYSQTNGLVSASVAKASTTQVGTVQLTDTYSSTDSTNAATGTAIAAAIATLDATEVGSGAVKVSQTDGVVDSVTVETEALVSEGAIIGATTSTTALVTASDALEAIKLAKPDNYVASVTGYTTTGEEVTTTQGAAVKVLDGRGTNVTANDLWGTTATMDANGVITISHNKLSNPNDSSAWDTSITKVEDNKAYVGEAGDTFFANVQTERIKNGSYMFYGCSQLTSFSSDLSSLTNGERMFTGCQNLESFTSDLSSLTNGYNMFGYCHALTSFSSDLSSLTNGEQMFARCSKLSSFSSDLSSLTNGHSMFYDTELTSFSSDLPSLTDSTNMFYGCSQLTSFCGDLSSSTNGYNMFASCSQLTSFCGDLSSLTDCTNMFYGCKLDTESVEIIADTINTVTSGRIDISIGNETPNDEEDAAFKQMQDKGWDVFVNGSDTEYVPRTEGEATLEETGETTVAPKPYWAKPIEVTEDKAEYVGQDGKFYQVVGGQFIYVNDPETYGMFVSLEDAIANMRLTKYEKPVEEA